MKNFTNTLLLLFIGMGYNLTALSQNTFTGKTTTFPTTNNINVTADIYEINDATAPIILLFHQARFSRGEYREIAPKLNQLGYMCIAVDQRSGDKVNGVLNQTHAEAKKAGLATKYPDAYPDLVATLQFAKKNYPNRKIIIWGSSYSSALVFILGSQFANDITGILSFSPGEYFQYKNKTIVAYAKGVKCPVFITSAKNEHGSWEAIFEALSNPNKQSFLPSEKGFHGSKALWEEKPGNEAYWKAVKAFLGSLN